MLTRLAKELLFMSAITFIANCFRPYVHSFIHSYSFIQNQNDITHMKMQLQEGKNSNKMSLKIMRLIKIFTQRLLPACGISCNT